MDRQSLTITQVLVLKHVAEAVQTLLKELESSLDATGQAQLDGHFSTLCEQPGESTSPAAWNEHLLACISQVASLATQSALRSVGQGKGGSGGRSLDDLTTREIEILRLVATGLTNREIAATLQISVFTVETHLRSIFSKLEVSTRSAACRYALQPSWLADVRGPGRSA